jgi:hypothetical protein
MVGNHLCSLQINKMEISPPRVKRVPMNSSIPSMMVSSTSELCLISTFVDKKSNLNASLKLEQKTPRHCVIIDVLKET